ncbi:DUF397 domain-containing protein [Streptomyces sp. SP18BB07]|uniref:DUF397 domain-containing protein n=1 Tax=Streptomyces sp. SP18BB07 TaxID=3002522 RepID=UPI002E7960E0|nr:DUF397 domain-containing protein [Streptomyces sp. SP18BB07]
MSRAGSNGSPHVRSCSVDRSLARRAPRRVADSGTENRWGGSAKAPDPAGTVAELLIKISYSGANTPSCVEVTARPASILVRDSKNPQGPRLTLSPRAWTTFLPYASGS